MRAAVVIALSTLGVVLVGQTGGQEAGTLLQEVRSKEPGYKLGDEVKLLYAVKNTGDRPVTYTFSCSKLFDLWLRRGGKEIYRLSKGKMYAQMITTLKLGAGETRTFEAKWNQKDNDGHDVGPGVYELYAQLTSIKNAPPPTKGKLKIGDTTVAVVPVTVGEAVKRVDELKDRRVQISAAYRGWQPRPDDPNTRDGPPVTRSDWAISDSTGCMYVTGKIDLDPRKDLDRKVTVIGKLAKTPKGQVYMTLESATVKKKP